MIEDSEADALLLLRALQRGGFEPVHKRVDSARAMNAALQNGEWDLILADHAMPQFSAPEALELLKAHGQDVPFIIVSGHIEEETAVEAMMAGAHDYIMKDRLARLVPAVQRELRDAEVRRIRRQTEEALRRAQEELELRVEERTSDLHRANVKLERMIAERQQLENELLEIAENERRGIGLDLHDDLGQKLTGAGMMIKALQNKLAAQNHPSAREAGKIHALVEEITNHAHDLAREFSSLDSAEGDDLSALLSGLSANVKKMFGITCTVTLNEEMPALSAYTAGQLYKIAQEAVSNAIKHGKAKRVSIGLAAGPAELELTVRNDGLPFSPTGSRHRLGLRIMNYRANTIGAKLEITPLKHEGTVVTCILPLEVAARSRRRTSPLIRHTKPVLAHDK